MNWLVYVAGLIMGFWLGAILMAVVIGGNRSDN